MYQDVFGCLPLTNEVEWGWGRITPLADQREVWGRFEESAHPQSKVVHSPLMVTRTEDPLTGEVSDPIPGTRRPADMYFLPETHEVEVSHADVDSVDQETARHGLAGFVVLFAGFLLGLRTQFSEWKVYGACSIRRASSFFTTPRELARCMDAALPAWERLGAVDRAILNNVLFQHLRVEGMDFQWERFLYRYIVVDACYRIAVDQGKAAKADTHGERWERLSDAFGIPHDSDGEQVIAELVDLRNELFHESLWGGHALGHGYPETRWEPDLLCANFVDRVIFGILDIPAGFRHTRWWDTRDQFGLNLPRG